MDASPKLTCLMGPCMSDYPHPQKRGLFVVNYIIIASGYILCGLILAPVPRTDLEASSK